MTDPPEDRQSDPPLTDGIMVACNLVEMSKVRVNYSPILSQIFGSLKVLPAPASVSMLVKQITAGGSTSTTRGRGKENLFYSVLTAIASLLYANSNDKPLMPPLPHAAGSPSRIQHFSPSMNPLSFF